MPAAVQLPPHLSCPSLEESFPADDTVQLRKTFRLLLRPFEQLRPANQGPLQAGRGSHRQKRYGTDKECDGSVQTCLRPPPEHFASARSQVGDYRLGLTRTLERNAPFA